MNLGFSTQINGVETNFVKKIWASLFALDQEFYWGESKEWGECKNRDLVNGNTFIATPKIHTIREDKKDRWKVGNKIHFVINNRTKNRFQFAPIVDVKSIQNIVIKRWADNTAAVFVDDRKLTNDEIKKLSENDGFNCASDFFEWFIPAKEMDCHLHIWEGKLIHWTSFSY